MHPFSLLRCVKIKPEAPGSPGPPEDEGQNRNQAPGARQNTFGWSLIDAHPHKLIIIQQRCWNIICIGSFPLKGGGGSRKKATFIISLTFKGSSSADLQSFFQCQQIYISAFDSNSGRLDSNVTPTPLSSHVIFIPHRGAFTFMSVSDFYLTSIIDLLSSSLD